MLPPAPQSQTVSRTLQIKTRQQQHTWRNRPNINASRQGIQTWTGRCITCKHITNGTKTCTFNSNGRTCDIRQKLDCRSRNTIYMIQCKRCTANNRTDSQYIGQTSRRVRDRLLEHCRNIIQKRTDKSGVALLQLRDNRESVRRDKDQYIIDLANTLAPNGMNSTTDR